MRPVFIAMSTRAVVGPVPKCAFVVRSEIAMAIWALACWGEDLDKAPIAIGQETSLAEVYRQTKRAVESVGVHGLGVGT